MISFGARCISDTTIQKIDKGRALKADVPASFVELDPFCESDLAAISNVGERWHSDEGYGACIANCMKYCSGPGAETEAPNLNFYAITRQNSDFENLSDEDILALAQVYSENDGEKKIEYLEADPDNSYKSKADIRYAHAGSAMLDALKALYCGEKIFLHSTTDAVKFYENNHFNTSDTLTKEMYFC